MSFRPGSLRHSAPSNQRLLELHLLVFPPVIAFPAQWFYFGVLAMTAFRLLFLATVIVGWLGAGGAKASAQGGDILMLDHGWSIRSAAKADPSFADWRPATVPGTVLGTLVNDGVYTNIFFGTNLANIPRQPFASAWWFRDDFMVSRKDAAEDADLIFDGINYRANIWLNGKCIGTTNRIFGAYRIFTLDVSGKLKAGTNTLAVEVFPPRPGDFTMGFVDWNPWPPDRGMGLFRPVQLHFYHDVALANVFVKSDLPWLNSPSRDGRRVSAGNRAPAPPRFAPAALTICADLKNHLRHAVKTTVSGRIDTVKFSKEFVVQPGQTRRIEFTREENPQLNLKRAQLWWPWEL
ncbi:MAG: glycosyl hydrolase 2 galactose-binding domain-containing protein, partial [Limisphaerales bacterium]